MQKLDSFYNMFNFWQKIEHVSFFVQFFCLKLHHVQKLIKK